MKKKWKMAILVLLSWFFLCFLLFFLFPSSVSKEQLLHHSFTREKGIVIGGEKYFHQKKESFLLNGKKIFLFPQFQKPKEALFWFNWIYQEQLAWLQQEYIRRYPDLDIGNLYRDEVSDYSNWRGYYSLLLSVIENNEKEEYQDVFSSMRVFFERFANSEKNIAIKLALLEKSGLLSQNIAISDLPWLLSLFPSKNIKEERESRSFLARDLGKELSSSDQFALSQQEESLQLNGNFYALFPEFKEKEKALLWLSSEYQELLAWLQKKYNSEFDEKIASLSLENREQYALISDSYAVGGEGSDEIDQAELFDLINFFSIFEYSERNIQIKLRLIRASGLLSKNIQLEGKALEEIKNMLP